MSLAENIKTLRTEKGYSQKELADLAGVSQAVIWYYESGKKVPSVINAERIAKIFNVSVEELMYGKEGECVG